MVDRSMGGYRPKKRNSPSKFLILSNKSKYTLKIKEAAVQSTE